MVQNVFRFTIIAMIIAFVVGIIGTVSFGWTLDTSPYMSSLSSILAIILYILPMDKLSPILIIFIGSMVFRIAVTVIKTIWDLIPIRG